MKTTFRSLLAAVLLAAAFAVCDAQTNVPPQATLSATITDPGGNPYAFAVYRLQMIDSMGQSIPGTTSVKYQGQPVSATSYNGTLDATGFFSVNLTRTDVLTVSNNKPVQWQISISPPSTAQNILTGPSQAWLLSYATAVTANIDVTAPLTAQAKPIQFINLSSGQTTMVGTDATARAAAASAQSTATAAQGTAASAQSTAVAAQSTANAALPANGVTTSPGAILQATTVNAGATAIPAAAPAGTVAAKCIYSANTPQTPECYGAIGDGASHPLSTRFSTLAAAQAIYPFVTSLTQEIDWAALQLMSNTWCSVPSAALHIYAPGSYVLSNMWDGTNYQNYPGGNKQCSFHLAGSGANSVTKSVFWWDGPTANGVMFITGASGGTPCATNGCSMQLQGFNAGCQNTNIVATLPTGGSWTGATFVTERGGDSCTGTPTTATIAVGGSGTVTVTGAKTGPYSATSMLSLTNCQNCMLENFSMYGGDSSSLLHVPNDIDWHEGLFRSAVNTHNHMRNLTLGATSRVSPAHGSYIGVQWTGSNTNNDQVSQENISVHDGVYGWIDPLQQAVLINCTNCTADTLTGAMFVINSNWTVIQENGDFNAVTLQLTDGSDFLGYSAQGQGRITFINAQPELDGQFINTGTGSLANVLVETGGWGNGGSMGVATVTSGSGGTLCSTNGCTMTLTNFNGCSNTNFTVTLPTASSWTGATFTKVNSGYLCSLSTPPTTATLSNGGSGTATITSTTVLNEFIDAHGGVGANIELNNFGFFGTPGKINLSSGGAAGSKTFKANISGGTFSLPCGNATSDSDPTNWIISSPIDSPSSADKITVWNTNAGGPRCELETGSGNAAFVPGDSQWWRKASGLFYTKSGPLTLTLGGDYNSTTALQFFAQNGNASFQTPAPRWQFVQSGVEAGTDNGSGSTLTLQRNIGNSITPSWQTVFSIDRTTGNMNYTGSIAQTGAPGAAQTGCLSVEQAIPSRKTLGATEYLGACTPAPWLDTSVQTNWRMDEGKNTTLTDSDGTLNLALTGTPAGSITGTFYSTLGTPYNAQWPWPVLNLNGTDDQASAVSSALATTTFPVSMGGWVCPAQIASTMGVFQNDGSSSTAIAGFFAQMSAGGNFLFGLGKNTGTTSADYFAQKVSSSPIAVNSCHLIGATYTNNTTITLYYDGATIAQSIAGTSGVNVVYAATPKVVLGGDGTIFPRFSGKMWGWHFYQKALSAADWAQRFLDKQ